MKSTPALHLKRTALAGPHGVRGPAKTVIPVKRLPRVHFLARHPICGACGAALATQVHHLQPVERRPDLALDWDNLAPVCTRCHGNCNARERQGLETASLFANFKRLNPFA